ncbi:MAG: membrane integrity-associated transporter subunit PqiC [Xanthomonadales bacterium]|nr:membrane integrity-associated transporter subunit PqiC [Xanthomonadales bacterium]
MIVRAALLLTAMMLAACSVPTVPDQTWYRLPPPPAVEKAAAVLNLPIAVAGFSADGIYADQALVYALDPGARQVRQYHYQLWVDPPGRMLQRRLIVRLRQAGLAGTVTDELPASAEALRVRGVILRLDRTPLADGGVAAVVAIKLRADAPGHLPLVEQIYRAEKPASGSSVGAFTDALGEGIDEVFAAFQADLERNGVALRAR